MSIHYIQSEIISILPLNQNNTTKAHPSEDSTAPGAINFNPKTKTLAHSTREIGVHKRD